MPMYEYECPVIGTRIDVNGRMSDPPPEWIGVDLLGDWIPLPDDCEPPTEAQIQEAIDGTGTQFGIQLSPDNSISHWVMRRVYCEGVQIAVKDYAVNHAGGVPVSKSLPRRNPRKGTPDTLDGQPVLRFKDGGYSNRNGQPVVRNKADRTNEEGRTGLKFD